MKITVTKEVEVEMEISFPAYYAWGFSYYKVNSEKSYIEIHTDEDDFSITSRKTLTPGFVEKIITKGIKCDQQDFARAFDQVFNKLEHEQAKIDPSHRFNQQPEEENGLSESERNEDKINEYYELENINQE